MVLAGAKQAPQTGHSNRSARARSALGYPLWKAMESEGIPKDSWGQGSAQETALKRAFPGPVGTMENTDFYYANPPLDH